MPATTRTHKPMPVRIYIAVGAALLVLTAITVWVAQYHLGEWNMVVALTIASIKALLVAFFFMHLFYDNKFYFFVFVMAVLFLVIFIGFSMIDTLRRGDIYREVEWPIVEEAVIYRHSADSLGAGIPDTTLDTAVVPDSGP